MKVNRSGAIWILPLNVMRLSSWRHQIMMSRCWIVEYNSTNFYSYISAEHLNCYKFNYNYKTQSLFYSSTKILNTIYSYTSVNYWNVCNKSKYAAHLSLTLILLEQELLLPSVRSTFVQSGKALIYLRLAISKKWKLNKSI